MTTSASAPAILPSSRLLEVDFSGIEAVLTGWFARDRILYRIAKLGAHALVASHLIKQPISLDQPDADLGAALAAMKKTAGDKYIQAKRTVHGTAYGMTPHGMVLMFPTLYGSLREAQHVQEVYFNVAPGVRPWQHNLQRRAHDQGYLGGPPQPGYTILTDTNAHPYGYKHYYYGVLSYKAVEGETVKRLQRQHVPLILMNDRWYQIVPGPDAKSCIAFYPQSTAAGILKEVLLQLFAPQAGSPNYIGGAYFGRTPLRAPIHDSLFLEVPPRKWDRVLSATYEEMLRPVEEMPLPPEWDLGTHVTIGVEGKWGVTWDKMTTLKAEEVPSGIPATYSDLTTAERIYWPATEAEEEDLLDLDVSLLLGADGQPFREEVRTHA